MTKGRRARGPSIASGAGSRFAAVFFDSGDTLMRPRLGRWWPKPGFAELLADPSVGPRDPADLRQVEAAGARYLAGAAPATTIEEELRLYAGYYRRVLPLVLDPVPNGLEERLAEAAVFDLDQEPFEDALPALEELQRVGYRLGIVSNAGPSLRQRYRDLGLEGRFHPFVLSSVVGSEKPDQVIYQRALEASGLSAEQVVFVDDVAHNVHAAEELGMFGVLVCRGGVAPPADLATVTDLRELPALLERPARGTHPVETQGGQDASSARSDVGETSPHIDQRLAAAPISWGVCEVPGWGRELAPDRVLREMSSLGIRATELGAAGYLPTDPVELRDVLAEHGLRLVAGFVPVVIHDPSRRREGLRAAATSARTLAEGGADVFVSAIVVDEEWAPRIPLGQDGWQHLLDGLGELDRLAADHGLVHALHPHVGTLIQDVDEVQRVLDNSDVGWCLDSGHLFIGGYDPVAFAERAGERVRHVHLKDVDGEVARASRDEGLDLVTATQQGLFVPLGQGDARPDETVQALELGGYDGWYVLEQDTALRGDEPPEGQGPVEDVRRCADHLRRLFADAAWGAGAAS